MRINSIKSAWLLINHPSGVCTNCDRCLPYMLPKGGAMDIITPLNNSPTSGWKINPPTYNGTGPVE